ncbi:hypothetical protein L3Y34_013603 [Caenorhabditis briggsae]|uniref:Uncharacterized protein n=1 Tax=Caenorhabditis briggsae TaxID=6238 RepID=A0AAE9CWV2_CAEBR|nr:hypothetical protein L3Y34_013603 [Caenorhabditis briggsae]
MLKLSFRVITTRATGRAYLPVAPQNRHPLPTTTIASIEYFENSEQKVEEEKLPELCGSERARQAHLIPPVPAPHIHPAVRIHPAPQTLPAVWVHPAPRFRPAAQIRPAVRNRSRTAHRAQLSRRQPPAQAVCRQSKRFNK